MQPGVTPGLAKEAAESSLRPQEKSVLCLGDAIFYLGESLLSPIVNVH